jgi:hypothetical protein
LAPGFPLFPATAPTGRWLFFVVRPQQTPIESTAKAVEYAALAILPPPGVWFVFSHSLFDNFRNF